MNSSDSIGLDSQCFSYLIDALSEVQEPVDRLAEERLALIRIWLYTEGTFYLCPTVVSEAERIRQEGRRTRHERWRDFHFLTPTVRNEEQVASRTKVLEGLHPEHADCRVLAEAEDIGLSVLLSYDRDLIDRLAGASDVRVLWPTGLWGELGVPRGTKPVTAPAPSNPLTREDWWRW